MEVGEKRVGRVRVVIGVSYCKFIVSGDPTISQRRIMFVEMPSMKGVVRLLVFV